MTDLLRMDFINSLPQPIVVRDLGCDVWWPLIDIDVETGLLRIDVYGLPQIKHLSDVGSMKDADGIEYDPDDLYLYEEAKCPRCGKEMKDE